MSQQQDRRTFLSSLTVGAAASCVASQLSRRQVRAAQTPTVVATPLEPVRQVVMHYTPPYDFGVMQGPQITDQAFVSKNQDLPSSLFADQQRMRWALQHMSVLQCTQRIARAGEVLRLTHRPLPLDAVTVKSAQDEDISVAEWLSRTSTDGFIAVYLSDHHGPLVATEEYFHGLTPRTCHHLWSMSKSLSVGLVAIAMERDKLRRSDRIGDILPELAKCGLGDATLDDVLNMASGAKNFVGPKWTFDGMVEFSMKRLAVAGQFLELNSSDTECRSLGYMGFIGTVEKERPHGQGFDYKDIDSRTAVAAAERVLGGPFHELFTELIWSQIGAEHDAYVCCDQFGSALTPLGISATLSDCARWGLIHLPNYGRVILPPAFVHELVHPHCTFLSPNSRELDTVPKATLERGGYRDQYWIYPRGPGGGFAAGGWMGQQIRIFPALNVVIVQLATLWPDNYPDIVPDGPAFLKVAEYVSRTYREQGV